MASHFRFAAPSVSMLGKLAASASETLRTFFGEPVIQPLPILSRRQQLAALVDATKRAQRR
jgi:hypothetical protein